jgi:hypothetical protein
MLIVGGAAAFTAIAVFLLWRLVVTFRSRRRRRQRRPVAGEKRVEKIGAEQG